MTVRYDPKSQCIRACAALIACYGFEERSKTLWDESYMEGNTGPGLSPSQMAEMVTCEGTNCRLMAFQPSSFDSLYNHEQLLYRPILMQIRGAGGQKDRFFAVATLSSSLGASVHLNLPRGFDIEEIPSVEELFTGTMVVPVDIPPEIKRSKRGSAPR